MVDKSYTFNTGTGAAKSSQIENDQTTVNPEENVAVWNPEVESWDEFEHRTK